MSGEITNYGTLLKKATTSIGELVKIDPPEYTNPTVEATNHASGGVRNFISGGLREMTAFKATINYKIADIALLVTDLVAGTMPRIRYYFQMQAQCVSMRSRPASNPFRRTRRSRTSCRLRSHSNPPIALT